MKFCDIFYAVNAFDFASMCFTISKPYFIIVTGICIITRASLAHSKMRIRSLSFSEMIRIGIRKIVSQEIKRCCETEGNNGADTWGRDVSGHDHEERVF